MSLIDDVSIDEITDLIHQIKTDCNEVSGQIDKYYSYVRFNKALKSWYKDKK